MTRVLKLASIAAIACVVSSVSARASPDKAAYELSRECGESAATFLGLPHEPRSLNWVHIAQRSPVRILLNDPLDALMRIGASSIVIAR
jgi:hypothetical protein